MTNEFEPRHDLPGIVEPYAGRDWRQRVAAREHTHAARHCPRLETIRWHLVDLESDMDGHFEQPNRGFPRLLDSESVAFAGNDAAYSQIGNEFGVVIVVSQHAHAVAASAFSMALAWMSTASPWSLVLMVTIAAAAGGLLPAS